MMLHKLSALVVALALALAAGEAQAVSYTVVDLTPAGFNSSEGFDAGGGQQVGCGRGAVTGNNFHAFLWSGSAESARDLNPTSFTESHAYGVNSGQQIGYGYGAATGNNYHALLWSGSAASVLDLNPTGFAESIAYDVSGGQQVGRGWGGAAGVNARALLWSGNAASAVDLHQFLPTGFVSSEAFGIDGQHNIVGWAYDAAWNSHAILWVPVPEPGSMAMLVAGVLCLLGYALWRRKRGHVI